MTPEPDDFARIAFLIPALDPGHHLLDLVRGLTVARCSRVVVVDDGSGAEGQEILSEICRCERTTLIRHPRNQGKGRALKTGFRHVLREFPGIEAIVTADADGQHLITDILLLAGKMATDPSTFRIGSRDFGPGVPPRNRWGNLIIRELVRTCGGGDWLDTQSGLRGIPITLARDFLTLRSSRYEFEMEMLLAVNEKCCPVEEVGIGTVYFSGLSGRSSFRPLRDSMRVLRSLFRWKRRQICESGKR